MILEFKIPPSRKRTSTSTIPPVLPLSPTPFDIARFFERLTQNVRKPTLSEWRAFARCIIVDEKAGAKLAVFFYKSNQKGELLEAPGAPYSDDDETLVRVPGDRRAPPWQKIVAFVATARVGPYGWPWPHKLG